MLCGQGQAPSPLSGTPSLPTSKVLAGFIRPSYQPDCGGLSRWLGEIEVKLSSSCLQDRQPYSVCTEVTDEGSCPPTLMRCYFPHSVHVVRTRWTNSLLFFFSKKQRQEFILWAFLESGHWQKTSCSEISEEM